MEQLGRPAEAAGRAPRPGRPTRATSTPATPAVVSRRLGKGTVTWVGVDTRSGELEKQVLARLFERTRNRHRALPRGRPGRVPRRPRHRRELLRQGLRDGAPRRRGRPGREQDAEDRRRARLEGRPIGGESRRPEDVAELETQRPQPVAFACQERGSTGRADVVVVARVCRERRLQRRRQIGHPVAPHDQWRPVDVADERNRSCSRKSRWARSIPRSP